SSDLPRPHQRRGTRRVRRLGSAGTARGGPGGGRAGPGGDGRPPGGSHDRRDAAMTAEDPGRPELGAAIEHLVGLGRRAGAAWEGTWDEIATYVRQRLTGDFAVDEFGHDPEFTDRIWLPLARALARTWFRCETRGIENLPTTGPALLVANHAGSLPLDGLVLQSMVH